MTPSSLMLSTSRATAPGTLKLKNLASADAPEPITMVNPEAARIPIPPHVIHRLIDVPPLGASRKSGQTAGHNGHAPTVAEVSGVASEPILRSRQPHKEILP